MVVEQQRRFWNEAARCVRGLEFRFRTLADVNAIVGYIEQWLPEENTVGLGLKELMVNAVEHGNLNIGYTLKTRLLENGTWLEEIERRLKLPANKEKEALLRVRFTADTIKFTVQDNGPGFDARKYLTTQNDKALHGRGLLLAKSLSFEKLSFRDKGRRAEAIVHLDKTK